IQTRSKESLLGPANSELRGASAIKKAGSCAQNVNPDKLFEGGGGNGSSSKKTCWHSRRDRDGRSKVDPYAAQSPVFRSDRAGGFGPFRRQTLRRRVQLEIALRDAGAGERDQGFRVQTAARLRRCDFELTVRHRGRSRSGVRSRGLSRHQQFIVIPDA